MDDLEVAPHWGAWIEMRKVVPVMKPLPSHPTGVRGLKYKIAFTCALIKQVAPHWGAWIEIRLWLVVVWRGLCRTPLGCVD